LKVLQEKEKIEQEKGKDAHTLSKSFKCCSLKGLFALPSILLVKKKTKSCNYLDLILDPNKCIGTKEKKCISYWDSNITWKLKIENTLFMAFLLLLFELCSKILIKF
jgi:hypothetical protein